MRHFCLMTMLLLFGVKASAQETFSPPALNTVEAATLSPSYSCRTKEEFQKGYRKTALFLSESVKRYNSPDLLFNGACGSEDHFQSRTHGANESVIADLGPNFPLENVPPLEAISAPGAQQDAQPGRPQFKHSVPVRAGHTYAVRLDKPKRAVGWFVFTVTRHVPNQLVEIRYSVREYKLTHKGIPPPARADDTDSQP